MELEILTLPLPEAWDMFKILAQSEPEYKQARFGREIKFDINDYLKRRTIIKPKSGRIIIRGRTHSLESFETELEDRERTIKKWLIENYMEEELTKPRGER